MTQAQVVDLVWQTLRETQKMSGREVPDLNETTTPIGDLDGFDSLMGVELTVILGQKLNVTLPGDINFCVSEDGQRALQIREIADRILGALSRT